MLQLTSILNFFYYRFNKGQALDLRFDFISKREHRENANKVLTAVIDEQGPH